MDYITILLLIIGAANIFFLFLLLVGRSENKYFGVFSLYIISTLFWIAAMYFFRLNTVSGDLLFTKLLYVSATVIPSSFLYFTYMFPFNKFYAHWKGVCIVTVNSLLALATFHTDLIIKNVVVNSGHEHVITFGSFYLVYAFYIMSFFVLGFWNLYRKYKITKDEVLKKQSIVLLGGYVVAANIACVTNLFLPYFGYYELNWVGQICTGFVVGFLTYAVFRHKLFQTKALVAELLFSVFWIFLLTRTLLSDSVKDGLYNGILFGFSVLIGLYVVQSILNEINNKLLIEETARELEKKNIELARISAEKTEFVSLASHQIRGPLTSIKGYSSMLLEGDFGKIPKQAQEAAKVMMDSCNTLTRVVNDYLDITRIEQGRMKYDFTDIDIRGLVNTCIQELMPSVQRAGLECVVNLPEPKKDIAEEWWHIKADGPKLKQVILNLIDNSIKYTPKGSINIKLSETADKQIRFEISDTGVGIAPTTMPKLFAKFSRADNASETNILGTGLGLYVAKMMVEAFEGKIWAESKGEGKGSTFIVELKEKR